MCLGLTREQLVNKFLHQTNTLNWYLQLLLTTL